MVDIERVRKTLCDEVEESRVQKIWARLERSSRSSQRRMTGRIWSIGVAFAALSAVLIALNIDVSRGPLELETGPLPTQITAGQHLLSDRSRIHVHRDSRLDVLQNDGQTLGLALRIGRVRFEVEPGGPRTWRVESGGVVVEVVGTVFEVEREGEHIRVSVERGAVLVRGIEVPDQVQRVEAGGVLEIGKEQVEENIVLNPSRDREAEEVSLSSPPLPKRTQASPPLESWRHAAGERRFEDAFSALGEQGLEREIQHASDAESLLQLADVARLSGHPERALPPLERVIREHSGDPRAALAAYMRGRIELHDLSRFHDAAQSIERSLELGLPDVFREAALAQRIEALGRAGLYEQAKMKARSYLEHYPHSLRRERVERWLVE